MSSNDQEWDKTAQMQNIDGAAAAGGGDAADMRHALGPVYKPSGQVHQHFYQAPPAIATSLHQLPPPPLDFAGRGKELAELAQAITQESVTISCLRGMGGVGKTALVLKLAQQLAPRYPDAQLYLDLQGTSDNPLTPAQAMAHVIRAYHPTARLPDTEAELQGLYHSVLHGQRAILLMDNAVGREQVEPLLPPDSSVLLLTSRNRFTLPGLKALNLGALPAEDARTLLLQIAPRIDDRAEELAALCGCLPLALLLAGSVLAEREDLQPQRYLRRLADQQTRLSLVDASLSLSYDLLQEELRRLWCALSVFPATFHLVAAMAVWQMDEDPAQDALGELVRYSLVEWHPDTRRYGLHDLARLFAGAHLAESERYVAQRRHSEHYEQVLRAADELYLQGGRSVLHGLGLFGLEWPNIEAGQSWVARHSDGDDAIAHLCALYPDAGSHCLDLRQPPHDRIHWLENALEAARRLGHREAQGAHLGSLGNVCIVLGQVEAAIGCFSQALAIHQEITALLCAQSQNEAEWTEARRAEGADLGNLGSAYAALGQTDKAIDHFSQALTIAQEIGDRRNEGTWLGSLGNAYYSLGQTKVATDHYSRALSVHQEIGDRRAEGVDLGNLGTAYWALGQIDRAIDHFSQALAIAQEIGDCRAEENHLGSLGNAYSALGQAEGAIVCYSQALAIAQEIRKASRSKAERKEAHRAEGSYLASLGASFRALGQVEIAIDYYSQALAIAQEIGDRRAEGTRSWNLGLLYEETDPAKAVELLSVCVAYEREIGHPDAEADARHVAQIQARLGT